MVIAMKLSRAVSYGLQTTLLLAREGSDIPVPSSRLAAEGKMPERFLLQILRNLVTHGILRSTRGVDGGYSLIRSPDEVSLLEVIEAIEGPLNTGDPIAEGMSEESQLRLHDALQQVTDNSRRQLEAIKLAQLLEPPLDLTVKGDPDVWAKKLGGRMLETGSVRLIPRGRIEELTGFAEGAWWVQNAAASIPAWIVGCSLGTRMIEAAAGIARGTRSVRSKEVSRLDIATSSQASWARGTGILPPQAG